MIRKRHPPGIRYHSLSSFRITLTLLVRLVILQNIGAIFFSKKIECHVLENNNYNNNNNTEQELFASLFYPSLQFYHNLMYHLLELYM